MDNQISQNLFEYRKKSGYSQEELADKIGVSRQAVSKWERGESSPDTENLIALARLYSISIDDLINASPAQETSAETEIIAEPVAQSASQTSENADAKEQENKEEKQSGALGAAFILAGLVVYLLIGFLAGGWKYGWVFILAGLVAASTVKAIRNRNPSHFAIPLLAVAIYCGIGLTRGIWHPTWIVFIAIPIYYAICEALKKH